MIPCIFLGWTNNSRFGLSAISTVIFALFSHLFPTSFSQVFGDLGWAFCDTLFLWRKPKLGKLETQRQQFANSGDKKRRWRGSKGLVSPITRRFVQVDLERDSFNRQDLWSQWNCFLFDKLNAFTVCNKSHHFLRKVIDSFNWFS